MILCVNKSDIVNPYDTITQETLNSFVEKNDFHRGIFTSAKTGLNTEKALTDLVTEMMRRCPIRIDTEHPIAVKTIRKLEPKPAIKKRRLC